MYSRSRIQELEDIRSQIKHGDPESIDLESIRATLGSIILDLQVLQSLRRPDSYFLQRTSEDGMEVVEVTVKMILGPDEAEDMIKMLWLSDD